MYSFALCFQGITDISEGKLSSDALNYSINLTHLENSFPFAEKYCTLSLPVNCEWRLYAAVGEVVFNILGDLLFCLS